MNAVSISSFSLSLPLSLKHVFNNLVIHMAHVYSMYGCMALYVDSFDSGWPVFYSRSLAPDPQPQCLDPFPDRLPPAPGMSLSSLPIGRQFLGKKAPTSTFLSLCFHINVPPAIPDFH